MQLGFRKKISEKKQHFLGQVQRKNEFVTGAAFNIELQSREINVPDHQ